VARAIVEADVVVTCQAQDPLQGGHHRALKNWSGSRQQGISAPPRSGLAPGGDCYPGGSVLKRAIESRSISRPRERSGDARVRVEHDRRRPGPDRAADGDETGVEGAWSATTRSGDVPRSERILNYGRPRHARADAERRVLHVVDATVRGRQRPSLCEPLELACCSAAAIRPGRLVGAHLLGYDPHRVALARERSRLPLADRSVRA